MRKLKKGLVITTVTTEYKEDKHVDMRRAVVCVTVRVHSQIHFCNGGNALSSPPLTNQASRKHIHTHAYALQKLKVLKAKVYF